LIAVEIFVYPLVLPALGGKGNNANGAQADNSTLENISGAAATNQVTPFAEVVAKQTGLTTDALTTQLQAGSTVADLVAQNKGDLDAVTKAASSALDDLVSKGGAGAQIVSRLGTDNTAIATEFEQGKLQTRAQGLLTTVLMTGAMPSFQGQQNGAGGTGSGGNNGTAGGNGTTGGANGSTGGNGTGRRNNGTTAESTAESTADVSQAGGNNGGTGTGGNGTGRRNNGATANGTPAPADQNGSQVALQPTAQPTLIPATPIIRPTVIAFPTFVPTLDPTLAAESTAEATSETSSAAAPTAANGSVTCIITPIYDLNLRDKPSTDGTIYLSIPFSTAVTANGHTSDNWYSVTYNGKDGWVSGDYVSTDGKCDKLPTVTAP
jgi:uncharacterized protein YgiM (DUF1202 family)